MGALGGRRGTTGRTFFVAVCLPTVFAPPRLHGQPGSAVHDVNGWLGTATDAVHVVLHDQLKMER